MHGLLDSFDGEAFQNDKSLYIIRTGMEQPQLHNLYLYVFNIPTTFVDPKGTYVVYETPIIRNLIHQPNYPDPTIYYFDPIKKIGRIILILIHLWLGEPFDDDPNRRRPPDPPKKTEQPFKPGGQCRPPS